MRNGFIGLILAFVTMLVGSPVVFAQTASQPRPTGTRAAGRTPDLSGVWWRGRGGGQPRGRVTFDGDPSMTPAGAEKYKAYVAATKDRPEMRNMLDPMITSCSPPGPTRIMQEGRPFDLIQAADRVILLFETDHWVRNIWMDGREHPVDVDPTWMGHSIGRWDGDTLVVDTVGINQYTWLDGGGRPHSDALHVVERFRRVDQNTLEVSVVYEDPEMYTRPWTGKISFVREPNALVLENVQCEDRILREMESDPCATGAWEISVICDERRERVGRRGEP